VETVVGEIAEVIEDLAAIVEAGGGQPQRPMAARPAGPGTGIPGPAGVPSGGPGGGPGGGVSR